MSDAVNSDFSPVFAAAADAADALDRLALSRLRGPLVYRAETGSTNDLARELAAKGAPAGALVLAEHQTAGRGRRGARWLAAPRSALLLSLLVRPEDGRAADEFRRRTPWLALLAAAAMARALVRLGATTARVKWPNDVLLDGRKCGGVLVEAGETFAVVGLGLNVHAAPPALAGTATTLAAELGRPADRRAALEALLVELDRALVLFAEGEPDALRAVALERADWPGRRFRLRRAAGAATGRAVSLDESGRLILELDNGSRVALAGSEELDEA